jgi:DNA polymerase-1
VHGFCQMLWKLLQDGKDSDKPTHIVVVFDKGRETFRNQIYPEYKAHRPPPPPDLAPQMRRCREIVDAFAIPVFQQDGFEADDLIAAAVAQARDRKWRVVIVSADKDLMQLVGDDVLMWDTMRDKVFGPPEVQARFGVPVALVRDWLALTGDSSDNVPGVPSVGPKTATDLLTQFGSLDAVYAGLDGVERKGLREKLRENEEGARLSQHLVTLRADVPCVFDAGALRYGGRDVEKLKQLYRDLGFTKHFTALETEPEPRLPAAPQVVAAKPAVQTGFVWGEVAAPSVGQDTAPAGAAPTATAIRDAAELERVATELRAAGRLAIVAETATPSPMRGTVVGFGLAASRGRSWYLPIGHRYVGAPEQLDFATVGRVLGPLLQDDTVPKASHDEKHLHVALARGGLSVRGVRFDTMLASYVLDSEAPHDLTELAARELGRVVGDSASLVPKARGRDAGFDEARLDDATPLVAGRAEAVLLLWDQLSGKLAEERLDGVMETIELPLAPVLAEMESAGVLVDAEHLRTLGRRVEKELAVLELEAHRIAGRVFNVNSPRQLETLLFDDLKLKHVKRTKTSRSTDAETLEALAEEHALPKVILEIRQLAKLKGTYIDTLPSLMNPETGRIHTRWEQAVAATGRLSSSDPNLQNIPIRSDLGREIRAAFVSPPGATLVSADYSQIELRVLAHLSKDAVLVDAFRSGQDVHTRTAIEVFGVAEGDVNAELRRRAKAVNFGIVYGQGDSGLAKSLGIPRTEAASFIAAYFRRYEGVRRFMNEVLESARVAGSVRTLFGRRRMVPDIRSENRGRRLAAERVAMNTPIQGTAADLLKLAMLAFRTPPTPGSRMVLTVHDELVFEVPDAEVDAAMAAIRGAMESVHTLEVPLVVDVGRGKNWSEAH